MSSGLCLAQRGTGGAIGYCYFSCAVPPSADVAGGPRIPQHSPAQLCSLEFSLPIGTATPRTLPLLTGAEESWLTSSWLCKPAKARRVFSAGVGS